MSICTRESRDGHSGEIGAEVKGEGEERKWKKKKEKKDEEEEGKKHRRHRKPRGEEGTGTTGEGAFGVISDRRKEGKGKPNGTF